MEAEDRDGGKSEVQELWIPSFRRENMGLRARKLDL